MLQALLSGVASVKAHQSRMNVIGNNLANVDTTAYKGSRAGFQDLLSQTVQGASSGGGSRGGTNAIQYGLGVMVGSTEVNNEQGSLGSTNRPTDLALQGNGYFMVGVGAKQYYTRDGSFDLDSHGDLVQRGTGGYVLGWSADANGKLDPSQSIDSSNKIHVPVGLLNAVQVTTSAAAAGNLSAGALSTDKAHFSTRVFDSLGAAHDLTIEMTSHTTPPTGGPSGATSSWDWTAYEGAAGTGTVVGSSTDPGNEKIYFDANGNRLSALADPTANKVTLPAAGGSSPFPVNVDFSSMTGLSTSTNVTFKSQNGYGPGSLTGISIGSDGVINGIFSNGLNRTIGQVAVASFSNPQGLLRSGNNLWDTSENSGLPSVGAANSGDRGAINAGYLEQSNVDISTEFTDLIVTQRGYQANTKVITTVDQMMEDIINIRR